MQSTPLIAFDQHAATTVAAVLLPGHRTPALHTLTSDSPTILRFVKRLGRHTGAVRCCYEAGPCGFALPRALTEHGIPCDVIAPSLIPRRPGNRIKTDRRDAGQLAILFRAGALTPIHIPTEQEEAPRDLLRCREDIRADLLRARHRLSKFLLRHGRRYTTTKSTWGPRHMAWLRAQAWPLPTLDQTHHAYLRAVDEAVARLQTVEQDLRALLTLEPLRPRIQRLRCFRGIDDLTALTIAAELGDPRRFATAPRLMAFVGLIPSEHSSGTKTARGAITKTGHAHLRRVLVEAAWHYRHHPFVGRDSGDDVLFGLAARGQPLIAAVEALLCALSHSSPEGSPFDVGRSAQWINAAQRKPVSSRGSPTRAPRARQLPTNHGHAVSNPRISE